jgi:hypothetical protein
MRQIEIIEEPRNQRPWVAVDRETRRPVIRMQRLETLLRISSGLGWEVVTAAVADQCPPISLIVA